MITNTSNLYKGSNLPLSHLLCKRPGWNYNTGNTHVKDRIFKLRPIHGSVIYKIHWIPFPFRENSNATLGLSDSVKFI